MRKIFTTSLFILFTAVADAQLTKGKILLGGSIDAGTSKVTAVSNSYEAKGFNISPSVGSFYKENRVFGVRLNYGYSKNENAVFKSNSYGLGFFLRQYKPIGSGFYFFAEEGFFASYSKTLAGFGINETTSKTTGVWIGFKPGVSYALKKNLQLELVFNDLIYLSYTNQKDTHTISGNTTTKNDFNIGSNLNLSPLNYVGIGVKFLLGK